MARFTIIGMKGPDPSFFDGSMFQMTGYGNMQRATELLAMLERENPRWEEFHLLFGEREQKKPEGIENHLLRLWCDRLGDCGHKRIGTCCNRCMRLFEPRRKA